MAQVDTETNYIFYEDREALILSGGGARGAYQVGVLKAITEWLPEETPCPFEVLVGTSAGALNAAALAARAGSFRQGVAVLEEVWANFSVDQVVRVNPGQMMRNGLHWVLSVISGGWLLSPPRYLLDTAPLRDLIARTIPVAEIPDAVASGPINALAVATTSYSTGRAVTFFDAVPSMREWYRVRRSGVRRPIDKEVLMASAAIPFIFPAVEVDGQYYALT